MNKIAKIFGTVAVVAALAACNKEFTPEISGDAPEGYVKVTLTAQQGTKTSMEPNGVIDWSVGDAIAVVYNGEVCEFNLEAISQENGAVASFTGYAPVGVATPSVAYYPYVPGQDLSGYGKVSVEQNYQEYSSTESFDTFDLPMIGEISGSQITFTTSAAVVLIEKCPVSGDITLSYGSNPEKTITLHDVPETRKDLIFFVDGDNQKSFKLSGTRYEYTLDLDYNTKAEHEIVSGNRYKLQLKQVAAIEDVVYDTMSVAFDAVGDGVETTISVIRDNSLDIATENLTVGAAKNIVLDLNGYTLVGTCDNGAWSALITNNGNLTVRDNSDINATGEGTGKLISGATNLWVWDGTDDFSGSYASNTITNKGSLTVESGYIENMSTNGSAAFAIDNQSSAKDVVVNINGGYITAKTDAIRMFCNSSTYNNIVNVNGGTVYTSGAGQSAALWLQLPSSNVINARGEFNITGGTMKANGGYGFRDYSWGDAYTNARCNISGGVFDAPYSFYAAGSNVTITGGTFPSWVMFGSKYNSDLSVSGGKFYSFYFYNTAAPKTKFITGGLFQGLKQAYIADGYAAYYNEDPATKDVYPYVVFAL